jgi:hypothetical protein
MVLYFRHDLHVQSIILVSKSDHKSLVRGDFPLVCFCHRVGVWIDFRFPWMVLAKYYGYLRDFFYRSTRICSWGRVSDRAIPQSDESESSLVDLVDLLQWSSNSDLSRGCYTVAFQKAHEIRVSGCDIDFGSRPD